MLRKTSQSGPNPKDKLSIILPTIKCLSVWFSNAIPPAHCLIPSQDPHINCEYYLEQCALCTLIHWLAPGFTFQSILCSFLLYSPRIVLTAGWRQQAFNSFQLDGTVPSTNSLLYGTLKKLKFQKVSPTPSKPPLVRPQKCQNLKGTLFPEGNQLTVNWVI